jgi:methionyl-tRNA synthetase
MAGQKMGKSTGNVVDPFDQIKNYGTDQFRFYVLGSMPIDGDGEYNEDIFVERINNELVANIANLGYRVLSFANRTLNSDIGKVNKDNPLIKELEQKFKSIGKKYEDRDFKQAIMEILEVSAAGNKYFQEAEPWKNKEKAPEAIAFCTNMVKNIAILINPIMPTLSEKLMHQLNLKSLSWNDLNFNLENHKINKAEIIIFKTEKKEEEKFPLDLKVAEVKEARLHPNSEKLICMKIDIGEPQLRSLVAGLQKYYKPEEFIGKKIIVVSNLKPAKLGGELSQGMLLAASDNHDTTVKVLEAPNSKPGDSVLCGNMKNNASEIKYEEFAKLKIITKGKNVIIGNYADQKLNANGKEIIIDVPDNFIVQ